MTVTSQDPWAAYEIRRNSARDAFHRAAGAAQTAYDETMAAAAEGSVAAQANAIPPDAPDDPDARHAASAAFDEIEAQATRAFDRAIDTARAVCRAAEGGPPTVEEIAAWERLQAVREQSEQDAAVEQERVYAGHLAATSDEP